MRIHWRISFLSLGLLLIVLSSVAIPYLHHLVYTDSLPKSAIDRVTGHAVSREDKIGQAVTQEDRQLDELGVHIQTDADAKAYVEALVKRWGPEEASSHLPEFEERLARAEYAAVRNPQKLIPASRVANTFNHLMDEWQMPSAVHISVAELQAFRASYACTMYPKSVARRADGTLAPSYRPTEALFLLHMLDANEGIPSYVRDHVLEGHFPWNALKWLKLWHPAAIPTFQSELHPALQNPDAAKIAQYDALRRKYFANHPDVTFDHIVNDLFGQLGI